MVRAFISILILFFFFGCVPEYKNFHSAKVRYCTKCISLQDVRQFETNIGSIQLELTQEEISSYLANNVSFVFFSEVDWDRRIIFKRHSSLQGFEEYIVYGYGYNFGGFFSNEDSALYSAGTIDFNLGNMPLGFTKDTISILGKEYIKNPVNPISLKDFKEGYYSIIKWLYSLENDKRKVIKERKKYFDHDYYSSPEVEPDEMVLENLWQKEFLFNKFILVEKSTDTYLVTVEPETYAPLILYEEQEDDYAPEHGKYHINISDMSIRIRFSSEFTGLCCKD